MKLIVGLGNPEKKYERTRHNVGFVVLDQLAKTIDSQWLMVNKYQSLIINNKPLFVLAKPQTYMNRSGEAVKKITDHYSIDPDQLFVIHDDLDIKLGEYKIIKGKGPKEHNGLLDIYENLDSKDFWHIRVGVDNREKDNRIPGERYVLMNFEKEEMVMVEEVVNEVVERLVEILSKNQAINS